MPEWAVQWLFVGLVSLVLWFTAKTLERTNKSQTELFARLNTVEKDLSRLQGECKVRHARLAGEPG